MENEFLQKVILSDNITHKDLKKVGRVIKKSSKKDKSITVEMGRVVLEEYLKQNSIEVEMYDTFLTFLVNSLNVSDWLKQAKNKPYYHTCVCNLWKMTRNAKNTNYNKVTGLTQKEEKELRRTIQEVLWD